MTSHDYQVPNYIVSAISNDYGINVKALGAHGDGVSDDTAVIQTAINTGATNGRPVFIPTGVYRVGTLTLPSGATVVGAKGAKLVSTSIVFFIPRGNEDITVVGLDIESEQDTAITIGAFSTAPTGNKRITIYACHVKTNALPGNFYPISLYGRAEDVKIIDCVLEGGKGVFINNPIRLVVRECKIISNENGLTMRAYDSELYDYVIVEGNNITAQRMPIEIWGGGGPGTQLVVVKGNHITCAPPGVEQNFGISVVVGKEAVISDNVVNAETFSSYGVELGINGTIENNVIRGAFANAIGLAGILDKVTILGNRIQNTANGITLINNGRKKNITIVGNVIEAKTGIFVEGIPQGPVNVQGNIIVTQLSEEDANKTLHGISLSSTDEPSQILGNTLICKGSPPAGCQWIAIRNNDSNSIGHKVIGNLVKYEGMNPPFGKFWHGNAGTASVNNTVFVGNTMVNIANAGTNTGTYKAFGNTYIGSAPANAGTLFD